MIFVAGWSGTVVLVSSKDPVLWSRPYFVEAVSWLIINTTTTKLAWIWHCKEKPTKTTSHKTKNTKIHSKNKVEFSTLDPSDPRRSSFLVLVQWCLILTHCFHPPNFQRNWPLHDLNVPHDPTGANAPRPGNQDTKLAWFISQKADHVHS